jgi:adenine phosphoribosyltransferase
MNSFLEVKMDSIKKLIRDIPDFPKPGIIFKDITTLLKNGEEFSRVIEKMAEIVKKSGATTIVAAESRGFIFGAPISAMLKIPFVPVRKKGKLPAKTKCISYSLEYGEDTLCIHEDAIKKGEKVILIDDLLATGGTACAIESLVNEMGADVVSHLFLIELTFLNGKEKLKSNVESLIKY